MFRFKTLQAIATSPVYKLQLLDMDFLGKLRFRFLILWFCVFVSLKIANAETDSRSLSFFRWPPLVYSSSGISDQLPSQPVCSSAKNQTKLMIKSRDTSRPLQYDFYRELCPKAEKIVREVVDKLFQARPDVAPALLRLVFHDCFIHVSLLALSLESSYGCSASC